MSSLVSLASVAQSVATAGAVSEAAAALAPLETGQAPEGVSVFSSAGPPQPGGQGPTSKSSKWSLNAPALVGASGIASGLVGLGISSIALATGGLALVGATSLVQAIRYLHGRREISGLIAFYEGEQRKMTESYIALASDPVLDRALKSEGQTKQAGQEIATLIHYLEEGLYAFASRTDQAKVFMNKASLMNTIPLQIAYEYLHAQFYLPVVRQNTAVVIPTNQKLLLTDIQKVLTQTQHQLQWLSQRMKFAEEVPAKALPREELIRLLAGLRRFGFSEELLRDHPVFDEKVYSELEELRLKDPEAYVVRIAEARSTQRNLEIRVTLMLAGFESIQEMDKEIADKIGLFSGKMILPEGEDPRIMRQSIDLDQQIQAVRAETDWKITDLRVSEIHSEMRKINALCDNILKMEVNFKRQLSRLHPEIKELFDKQKALLAKAEKELDKTGFAAFQGRMMDEGVLKECDILVDHAAQQIADLNYKEAKQVITKLQSQLDYIKGQVAELEASLVSLIISQQHSQLVVGQLAGQVAVLKRRVAAFKNLDYGGVEDLEKQLLGIEANLNALKILADDKTLSTDQANILKSSESHVAAVVKALKFKEDRLERENDERWDKLWEDAEELRSKEWYEHETVFNSYLFSQKERLRHIIDPLSKYHAMTLVRKQIRDVYRISAGIGTLDEMKSTIDAQLATPFEDYTKV